jgi:hypothetical protein
MADQASYRSEPPFGPGLWLGRRVLGSWRGGQDSMRVVCSQTAQACLASPELRGITRGLSCLAALLDKCAGLDRVLNLSVA